MSSSQKNSDENPTPPQKSTVVLLLRELGSTTWRMFVPTIGLTVVGVLLDKQLETYPLFVIIGIVLGVIVTALLIRNQFKKL